MRRVFGVIAGRIINVAVVIRPRLGGTICARIYVTVPCGPEGIYAATAQRLRPLIRLPQEQIGHTPVGAPTRPGLRPSRCVAALSTKGKSPIQAVRFGIEGQAGAVVIAMAVSHRPLQLITDRLAIALRLQRRDTPVMTDITAASVA